MRRPLAAVVTALLAATAPTVVTAPAAATPTSTAPTTTTPLPVAASPVEQQRLTSLGIPLRDVLLIGGTVAPGPSGTPVLWSVSSGTPARLNAVDPVTGTAVARYDLPTAGGSWAIDSAPDGSVYVGTYGDGRLFRSTAAGGVVDLGRPIASQTFIWDVSVADDGTVFGGTSPGGRLFSYTPSTGQYRDYGQLVPGQAYVRTVAVAGDKVFAGTDPPGHLVEVDIATGAKRTLPPPAALDPVTSWVYDLDQVGGRLYARYGGASPNSLFVYDLAAGRWTDRLDTAHGLEVSPADEQGNVYLVKSGELVRYDPVAKTTTGTGVPFAGRVANTRGIGWAELGLPDYPGRSIVGLLWRGLMFRYNPTTGASSFVQTTIQGEPIEITALSDGPDDRVYVGGFLNGGFAAVDPRTGATTEFHTFGQSEAMTRHGDKLYVGVYPESRLYAYDPTKPWNSLEYSPNPQPSPVANPERLWDLKAEGQIRPRGLTSAGNHVAVGTMPDLGLLGGYLVVYDPATGQVVTRERNVVTDQSIVALAYRDGVIYGSTSIYGGQSATPPTRDPGADVRRRRPVVGHGVVGGVRDRRRHAAGHHAVLVRHRLDDHRRPRLQPGRPDAVRRARRAGLLPDRPGNRAAHRDPDRSGYARRRPSERRRVPRLRPLGYRAVPVRPARRALQAPGPVGDGHRARGGQRRPEPGGRGRLHDRRPDPRRGRVAEPGGAGAVRGRRGEPAQGDGGADGRRTRPHRGGRAERDDLRGSRNSGSWKLRPQHSKISKYRNYDGAVIERRAGGKTKIVKKHGMMS
jgi:outer membrane protein assembly factor BamB